MNYLVVKAHRSEFPNPIKLKKGAFIIIGEKYEGPEDWEDWYYCTIPGHEGGWVPRQIIERTEGGGAQALEDYTAMELDVDEGDVLIGARKLNGWVWCRHAAANTEGWVPLENLQPVSE
ncbi:ligand-binding protein SH3 [Pseudodesulfovibrio sp. F-1]|uniref:Ligand-binding protein SH3 n=1 Tax=Pseudodesulfovibrio alkaliphilus TaxID=2661613 RepID=A0A7K1KPN9_9BACT|nr:SH3 domain-containing protein [Pseudodesulfovibrio alkaliphilus]MUM78048.1 ligand-binding protein SH3 [Pseudodesulfovibrio alkaliphilus]